MAVCPASATAPVPTLMSQYSKPSAALVGSPLTLVGPLAPACAGGVVFFMVFAGVVPVCATAADTNESRTIIFSIGTPSRSSKLIPKRSHRFPPAHLSATALLRRLSGPAGRH